MAKRRRRKKSTENGCAAIIAKAIWFTRRVWITYFGFGFVIMGATVIWACISGPGDGICETDLGESIVGTSGAMFFVGIAAVTWGMWPLMISIKGAVANARSLIPPNDENDYSLTGYRPGVYFIVAGDEPDTVKIGYSFDPESRRKQLQTGSARPLRIVLVVNGDTETESRLHKQFAKNRMTGEWFGLDQNLVSYINQHAQGSSYTGITEWRHPASS